MSEAVVQQHLERSCRLGLKRPSEKSNELSLVGAAAAHSVQFSFGTLKVTQQLQWTLMGHWGAVLHLTGLLPVPRKRFQRLAAGAVWEDGRTDGGSLPILALECGGGRCSHSKRLQVEY